ncbi:a-factor receptor [Malassezia psittaci]|uniref:A-factor receptor n=1 Tax=Malassezia psittaci TaxID=1821823 RepID=A0AAF0F7U1_9BASI|nr:a-factor receptor [Malassezia psittaci]
MSDVALPIFTIISILLIVLPAASHWRAKNVVILVLIMWLAVGNLNTFINRVIWMNRSSNVAPVWCDISVKLMSMVTMGIPCAMFCIAQKLEAIASMRDVSRDASKSFQKKLYEAAICCALPLAYSILTILSQGHRFNIIEGQGCSPAIYLSPVSIVIDYGMPLFMSVLSLIYSVLALKHFIMHKREFESVLERSGNTLSTTKFLRMISFTLVDLLINFPILITGFSKELLYKDVEAYTSWELVHRNFSRVSEYPAYALNNPKGRKFLTVAELSAWMQSKGYHPCFHEDLVPSGRVLPQREPIGEGKCSGEDSPYASIYTPSDRSFVVADNENSMSSSDSAKNS